MNKIKKFNTYIKENFNYLLIKKGSEIKVSKEDFLKAGSNKKLDPNKIKVDIPNRKVIAKFEDFKISFD